MALVYYVEQVLFKIKQNSSLGVIQSGILEFFKKIVNLVFPKSFE